MPPLSQRWSPGARRPPPLKLGASGADDAKPVSTHRHLLRKRHAALHGDSVGGCAAPGGAGAGSSSRRRVRPPPLTIGSSANGSDIEEVITAATRTAKCDSCWAEAGEEKAGLEDEGARTHVYVPTLGDGDDVAECGGRHRQWAPEMSLIAPRLYVGSEVAAASLATLRAHGITHVLNCTPSPNAFEGTAGAPAYRRLGLLDSSADLPRMLHAIREGVAFIEEAMLAGSAVLVHCHRGISRSCTLAMAYLIWKEQRTADSVFQEVRAARRVCDPNLGYWCTLKDWERLVVSPDDDTPPPKRQKSIPPQTHATPVKPLSAARARAAGADGGGSRGSTPLRSSARRASV